MNYLQTGRVTLVEAFVELPLLSRIVEITDSIRQCGAAKETLLSHPDVFVVPRVAGADDTPGRSLH